MKTIHQPHKSTEREMMARAMAIYGKIRPCESKTFEECFTYQASRIFFWFNDEGGNTHVIVHEDQRLPVAS